MAEGFPRNPDYNNGNQEGFGYFQATQKNGRRWSTARTFLDPARRRPNLRIETEALAIRVLFDGRRAIGVAYMRLKSPSPEKSLTFSVLSPSQSAQLQRFTIIYFFALWTPVQLLLVGPDCARSVASQNYRSSPQAVQ